MEGINDEFNQQYNVDVISLTEVFILTSFITEHSLWNESHSFI